MEPTRPGLSVRQGMQWANELKHLVASSEPTCTLVLTSPAGRFVDIRLVRPASLCADAPNPPFEALLHEASAPGYRRPVLDWAFAGTASRSVTRHAVSPNGEGELSRAQWRHSIDSNHADAASVDDQGDCRAYWNPETQVMMEEELGEMPDPATGTLQVYRETWAVPEPDYRSSSPKQRVCAVLELDEPGAQGLFVRVGAWAQGILRKGAHVSVVRLHLLLLEGSNSETLDLDIRLGPHARDFPFPCLACLSSAQSRSFPCQHDQANTATLAKWTLLEQTMW